jgi:hypothetical protein
MSTIRASDAERDEVARILNDAAAAGRLSTEEAGERLAQASSARFREDLAALISDLPAAMEPAGPPAPYRRPRPGAWLLWGLLRVGVAAVLFAGLMVYFGLHFFFWPFFPVWPLAFLFIGGLMLRRRWYWRRRMHWGRPYWAGSGFGF